MQECWCLLAFIYSSGDMQEEYGEDHQQLRGWVGFLLGMEGGPNGQGMPRELFLMVMDLLMPSWDPLRRGLPSSRCKAE